MSDTEPDEPTGRFLPKLAGDARKRALADPGPTWRQYFFFSFAKVWTVLGFFVLDSFILLTWAIPFNPVGMVLSLIAAFYAEFLLFEYLWHRPAEPIRGHQRKEFRRTWFRPVPYGRWTAEADDAKAGRPVPTTLVDDTPNPDEFL